MRHNAYRDVTCKFRDLCSGQLPAFSRQRLEGTEEPHFYLNPKEKDEATVRGTYETLLPQLLVSFLIVILLQFVT